MSKAIWKSKNEPDLSLVENLKSALNAPDIIARMLVQRGIDTIDKVNAYFNPRVEDLHDPFLMKDMDKAIERIQFAQEKKEGVLIYGDYDVDGTTSVALAYSFFKDKFDKIDFSKINLPSYYLHLDLLFYYLLRNHKIVLLDKYLILS